MDLEDLVEFVGFEGLQILEAGVFLVGYGAYLSARWVKGLYDDRREKRVRFSASNKELGLDDESSYDRTDY